MADSRLDKLEAVVREMRKRLEPQAMRDSLERSWDPRGTADWTRVTDSAGAPASPPRHLLQFPGATITDDPTIGDRGATVVTVGGSPSGLEAFFSDDFTPDDTERLKFKDHGTPTINHLVLNTYSSAGLRLAVLAVAEDVGTSTNTSAVTLQGSDTSSGGYGNASLRSYGDGLAQTVMSAQSPSASNDEQGIVSANTGGSAMLTAATTSTVDSNATTIVRAHTEDGAGTGVAAAEVDIDATADGEAIIHVAAAASGAAASLTVEATAPGFSTVSFITSPGYGGIIMNQDLESVFVQLADSPSNYPGGVQERVEFGPYVLPHGGGAIAPNGTASIVLAAGTYVPAWGTSVQARVAVVGTAGSEALVWSQDTSASGGAITLNFTNVGASSVTPTEYIIYLVAAQ